MYNYIFIIEINQCHVVDDASLLHSRRIIEVVGVNSSVNLKVSSPSNGNRKTTSRSRNNINAYSFEPTKTDWSSRVALIRRNHNMVDKRRNKKVKRLRYCRS